MRRLLILPFILVFAACFRTVIQQPDGTTATVKTPCDAKIWLVEKKHGKPSQVLMSDSEFYRIRYYYESSRTEYDFAWNDVIGCQVASYVHLTGDGIK